MIVQLIVSAGADAPSGLDMPSAFQENNMRTGDENIFQEDMPQSVWEEATKVSSLFHQLPLLICIKTQKLW